MDELALTAADLATIAGGSVAAGILTQFVKKLLDLSSASVRSVAMLSGLVFVVTGTVLSLDETNIGAILLATLVGMQAGLAASATFDSVRTGLNHEAVENSADGE